MPTRPARKGFAPAKKCHRGWRDKVGFTFRPGRAVFVIAAHDQWYDIPPGKIPARLFRAFHYTGDKLGKFRLDAEYTWCMNYEMLDALGPDVMGMVHHDILAAMRRDPRIVIQTDWAVSDEFETITGDAAIRRLVLDAHGFATTALPEDDPDAAFLAGTILLAQTAGGALKQHKWADQTYADAPAEAITENLMMDTLEARYGLTPNDKDALPLREILLRIDEAILRKDVIAYASYVSYWRR